MSAKKAKLSEKITADFGLCNQIVDNNTTLSVSDITNAVYPYLMYTV